MKRLINAAATPKNTANMIENNPQKNGISSENCLINKEKKFNSAFKTLTVSFWISSAKKLSYAIAIPTIKSKIANKALSCLLYTSPSPRDQA